MITIHAMHPCPELYIDADVPVLRLIAHTLTQIHQQGLTNPLCLQHELMLKATSSTPHRPACSKRERNRASAH